MPEELFDVVDEKDCLTGSKPGAECVREGLLHCAIAVLLFDPQGRVYIQKRAAGMSWYPGRWTISVVGHVSAGESYEQAARREVREELGLDCKLVEVVKFQTPKWRYSGAIEWEYTTLFEGRLSDQRITLSDESTEGLFVPLQEFVKDVKADPEKFTPDSILATDYYRQHRQQRVLGGRG